MKNGPKMPTVNDPIRKNIKKIYFFFVFCGSSLFSAWLNWHLAQHNEACLIHNKIGRRRETFESTLDTMANFRATVNTRNAQLSKVLYHFVQLVSVVTRDRLDEILVSSFGSCSRDMQNFWEASYHKYIFYPPTRP